MSGPRIYCLAKPTFSEEALREFLSDRKLGWRRDQAATEAECLVESAGRVCYLSFTENTESMRFPNSSYLSNLIDQGHESVLEHASWTFLIDRVSRAFTHQLVRHRPGFAYSQLSQQYHDESEAGFVAPAGLDRMKGAQEAWERAMAGTKEAYREMLAAAEASVDKDGNKVTREERRWLRSTARSILPNATETTIVVSANARAWRHFLNLRGNIVGDYEMRRVSALLLEALSADSPALFADFTLDRDADGEPLVKRNRGSGALKK